MVPGDENTTNIPVILDRNVTVGTQPDFLYANDLYNKSTVRVADGSYVRLRTIRLSYNMPERITRLANANSVQLSLEGQNLWLLYSDPILNGQDPEFFSTGGVALPQPRMITGAIMISF